MASGIEIPHKDQAIYKLKHVPHGSIRVTPYFSKGLNVWRELSVYTPPNYNDTTENYPVLYLLHGGGENQRGWGHQGKANLILDNLIAADEAKPMLVVMLDGNVGSANGILEFDENSLKTFEGELLKEVIPFVEENYKAKTDASSRGLAGLSMGGLQTLYVGIQNTNMFKYLGVFSSGWFANKPELSNPQYDFMKDYKSMINNNLNTFWISMGGKEDIAFQNCKIMLEKFDDIGINYQYSEYHGGHAWPVWRHDLYEFSKLLFR